MNCYLVLKYHPCVQSVLLCILPIVHDPILYSLSICLLDTVCVQPNRHWNRIKHALRYLKGIVVPHGWCTRLIKTRFFGYTCVVPDLWSFQKVRHQSQTWYIFTCDGIAILWRSVKQTLMATCSSHSEILAIYETRLKCIWLRFISEREADYLRSKIAQQCCMKITWHLSNKLRVAISRMIWLSQVLLCTRALKEWRYWCPTDMFEWQFGGLVYRKYCWRQQSRSLFILLSTTTQDLPSTVEGETIT